MGREWKTPVANNKLSNPRFTVGCGRNEKQMKEKVVTSKDGTLKIEDGLNEYLRNNDYEKRIDICEVH